MPARRVLIVGLDGADWRIIDPLLSEGEMPGIKSIVDQGSRLPLHSSIPPVSPAAWVSFLLGSNPGGHGILDFREVDARRYEGISGRIVTSNDYPKATLFDVAGRAGRRVAAIRIPLTYPPWPVNGILISGPPTPDEGRLFSHPEELPTSLRIANLDIGNKLLEYPEDRQVEILTMQLDRTRELGTRTLSDSENYELAMIVVNTPDNAHHCFWHVRGETGKTDWIREFYIKTDEFIRSMLATDRWDLVMVMSDHGGGPRATLALSVNEWLRQLGLLKIRSRRRSRRSDRVSSMKRRYRRSVRLYRRWAPEAIQRRVSGVTQLSSAIDWSTTRAYGVHLFAPFFGIELNLKDRQQHGIIPQEEFEEARGELITQLRDSSPSLGLPVKDIQTREEAYGPDADQRLPDIILRLPDDVEGSNVLGPGLLSSISPPGPHETKSYHSPDGILAMMGEGVRRGAHADAWIEDLAPTVLSYLGLRPPAGMTGRVLHELFEPGELELSPSTGEEADPGLASREITPLSKQEEEQIAEALRGLGYLE